MAGRQVMADVRGMGRTWLPSGAWIVAAAATPWESRAVSPDDPTAVTLLACFVMVGVVGVPLGVGLGRLGDLRIAVVTAALAVGAVTVTCAVRSYGSGVRLTSGGAVVTAVLAFLFVVLALPLPSVGFIVGQSLRKRRK